MPSAIGARYRKWTKEAPQLGTFSLQNYNLNKSLFSRKDSAYKILLQDQKVNQHKLHSSPVSQVSQESVLQMKRWFLETLTKLEVGLANL